MASSAHDQNQSTAPSPYPSALSYSLDTDLNGSQRLMGLLQNLIERLRLLICIGAEIEFLDVGNVLNENSIEW